MNTYVLLPGNTDKQYILYRIGTDIKHLQQQTIISSDSEKRNQLITFRISKITKCQCTIETFIQIVKQIDLYNYDNPYYVYMLKNIKVLGNKVNNEIIYKYIKKNRFYIQFTI